MKVDKSGMAWPWLGWNDVDSVPVAGRPGMSMAAVDLRLVCLIIYIFFCSSFKESPSC